MSNQQRYNIQEAADAKKLWESRRAEMEWLYHVQGMNQQQLAEYFHASQSIVNKWMRRLKIKPRTKWRQGAAHPNYKTGLHSRTYRTVIVKDKCRKCGTTTDLGIHHKNDDHFDNRLENLEVLCNSCHMSETKRKWWKAKKAGLPTPKSNGLVGWKRKR